jgi:hypothetical protein
MGHNDHADDSELDNLPAEAWDPRKSSIPMTVGSKKPRRMTR